MNLTQADVFNARMELAKRGKCVLESLDIPRKLIPVFDGEARYRGAYGGRGSGKTRTFAKMTAVRGDMFAIQDKPGVILCAREFQNSLDDSSFAEVRSAILADPYLSTRWEIGATYIRHITRKVEYVFRGLRHNRESLKGLARILIAWPDEAEQITEESWQILIPTVREDGSEIWLTWNRASEKSATNQRFIVNATPDMKIVEMNWTDNPWFPEVLNQERLRDKEARPEDYDHVWEGAYKTSWKGAYFTKQLADAKATGRITYLDRHPNMSIRTYWDLGRKDHTAIWVCQWVDGTVRMIDFIEGSGQSPGFYFDKLRQAGYGGCHVGLPHDGAHVPPSSPDGLSYEDQARQAGFEPEIVKSGNKAAPMQRIDAARKVFPAIYFDKTKCEAGLKALAAYREKWDEERQVGLGPLHDWSSHCFHPDTKVLTRYGMRRISDLPETGEVMTKCGWKPYRSPRITKRNAQLVEVVFTDGHTVRCTPDHLFLTESGWKSAESLTSNTPIQSSLTASRSILMAASIGCGLAIDITRAVAKNCIVTLGSLRSVQSPLGATSTTKTQTRKTTAWKTLSAWMRASTWRTHGGKTKEPTESEASAMKRAKKLLTGTSPKRGACGIDGTRNAPKAGQNGKESQKTASSVASSSAPLSAKAETLKSIARQFARPLRIESVRPVSECCDVWDITVPGPEHFSLSNGAVVHNCADAFGLMCIDYEEPRMMSQFDYAQAAAATGAW